MFILGTSTSGFGMAGIVTTSPNVPLEGSRTTTTWVPVQPLTMSSLDLGDLGLPCFCAGLCGPFGGDSSVVCGMKHTEP